MSELEKWIAERQFGFTRTYMGMSSTNQAIFVDDLRALFDGKVPVEPAEEWRKQWEPWQLKDGMVLIPISELKRWRNVFASEAHPYQSPYAADIDKVLAASQEQGK
jgi:hypothetical protein